MKGTLVNLTVNPCKMCMPMGVMTAMYGIKKCVSILHGSQGCSTYIRRHMATHYNEPVDIASSSLTEEGTVYGGERNLIQGLLNLIRVYQPEVIGVATTCLAETIGEDIGRIIDKFYEEYPEHRDITIIGIPSAGYAGTQFEGFMAALYYIVKTVPMDMQKNNRVNIITSQLSPADTRYLKGLLRSFGIDYILLPDLSDNLDGGHKDTYQRLPQDGTELADIRQMAGARATIELSSVTEGKKSAARYLYETYGVPYIKCNLPVGLRDNDAFMKILENISGNQIPEKIKKERERYLDAMIDSHKYNAKAKAAVYGEPDFVISTVRMCVENGIMPLITATGSKCPKLKDMLEQEIQRVADTFFYPEFKIIDEVDFQTIEEYARQYGVNLLIGNSDGRRIAEKLGIPLVRRSFPVHDRMGGQRLRSLGYEGSLTFVDEISNAILDRKETTFREKLYKQYYKPDHKAQEINLTTKNRGESGGLSTSDSFHIDQKMNKNISVVKSIPEAKNEPEDKNTPTAKMAGGRSVEEAEKAITMEERTAMHPCYNCQAHKYARMHLPIAPKCNISCNYCLRKYDCPNESRPGVTTKVLNPEEAFQRYLEVRSKVENLTVVGIAGPGDALANFEETKKALALIREHDKKITFCLSTNGLMLPQYANELKELGVTHVTVTMNTVQPKTGALIYKYIEYMGEKYSGEMAASILLSNQLAGIKMLTRRGIICKVNIVVLKGINEQEIPEVVAKAKELGATITNIMQLIPVKGSAFEDLPLVSNKEIMEIRKSCEPIMKQMYHCKQCRADAIGTLEHDRSIEFQSEKTFHMAVATKSGMVVDQHFGQVSEFYVYEYSKGSAIFKEKRKVKKYCDGAEECGEKQDEMDAIIHTISDCDAVIAMRIGEAPKSRLIQKGIKIFTMYDRIEDSVIWAAKEMNQK